MHAREKTNNALRYPVRAINRIVIKIRMALTQLHISVRPPVGSPGLLSRSPRFIADRAGLVVPAGQRWRSRSRPVHLPK